MKCPFCDANTEALSISPLRSYIICKQKGARTLSIASYSGQLQFSEVPYDSTIVDIGSITWDESETYFDVGYRVPDEDQSIAEEGFEKYVVETLRYDIAKNDEGSFLLGDGFNTRFMPLLSDDTHESIDEDPEAIW